MSVLGLKQIQVRRAPATKTVVTVLLPGSTVRALVTDARTKRQTCWVSAYLLRFAMLTPVAYLAQVSSAVRVLCQPQLLQPPPVLQSPQLRLPLLPSLLPQLPPPHSLLPKLPRQLQRPSRIFATGDLQILEHQDVNACRIATTVLSVGAKDLRSANYVKTNMLFMKGPALPRRPVENLAGECLQLGMDFRRTVASASCRPQLLL